jgi:hypothetical protein
MVTQSPTISPDAYSGYSEAVLQGFFGPDYPKRNNRVCTAHPHKVNIFCNNYADAKMVVDIVFKPLSTFQVYKSIISQWSGEWHGFVEWDGTPTYWIFKWTKPHLASFRECKGDYAFIKGDEVSNNEFIQCAKMNYEEVFFF